MYFIRSCPGRSKLEEAHAFVAVVFLATPPPFIYQSTLPHTSPAVFLHSVLQVQQAEGRGYMGPKNIKL